MVDKIKCSHILLKKHSEALQILERIKKGESFADLARELSIDRGSGKRGGDLGFFGRGQMVKAFEEAAFKLNKGELTNEPLYAAVVCTREWRDLSVYRHGHLARWQHCDGTRGAGGAGRAAGAAIRARRRVRRAA